MIVQLLQICRRLLKLDSHVKIQYSVDHLDALLVIVNRCIAQVFVCDSLGLYYLRQFLQLIPLYGYLLILSLSNSVILSRYFKRRLHECKLYAHLFNKDGFNVIQTSWSITVAHKRRFNVHVRPDAIRKACFVSHHMLSISKLQQDLRRQRFH